MKVKKIFSRIRRKFIFLLDGVNTRKYMKKYNKWLKKQGMDIDGLVKYINHTVFLDGTDYTKIHIGNNVVISVDTIILVHDFSLEAGMIALNKGNPDNEAYELNDVYIGESSFIGAKTVILAGTKIGKNCIVGAGSVLPGKEYPDNSIIVGNPGRVIGNTIDWANKKIISGNFKRGYF